MRSWVRFALICVAIVTSVSCSRTERPAVVSPSEGGETWRELRSEHFVISTDLPEVQAREAIETYEHEYRVLETSIFQSEDMPSLPTHVVVFRNKREFAEFAGGSITVSMYYEQLQFDLEPSPTIITYGRPLQLMRFRFRHELAHRFMRIALGAMPAWLDEGLASYYSNVYTDGDAIVMGQDDLVRSFTQKTQWKPVNRGTHLETQIPVSVVPSATELMGLDRSKFYVSQGIKDRHPDAEKLETIHYAGSWALVHMMFNGPPEYTQPFARALQAASEGGNMEDALGMELAEIPAKRIDRDFYWYLKSEPRHVWRVPYGAQPPVKITGRDLDPSEVLVLWGRLAADPETSARYLEKALRLAPGDADAHYWLGTMAARGDALVASEGHYRASLSQRPNDPRYLNALAWLYAEHAGPWPPDERGELVGDVIERLSAVAETASQFDTLAWHLYVRGDMREAATASRESIALDPNCWRCFDTYARILFASGAPEDAAASQSVALDRLPHRSPASLSARLGARLERYQQALESDDPGKAGPGPG